MKNILNIILSILFIFFFVQNNSMAQLGKENIPVSELPISVKKYFDTYVQALESESLETFSDKASVLLGGTLVNDEGKVRSSVKNFSLKKDYEAYKNYVHPIIIVKVNIAEDRTSGYGSSQVEGDVYKIWIKHSSQSPANNYISIIYNKTNSLTKIIGVGSL